MLKAVRNCGNWLRSIQGWLWLVLVAVPTVATYLAGWLKDIPVAVEIAATMGALAAGVVLVYFGILLFDRLFPAVRAIPAAGMGL